MALFSRKYKLGLDIGSSLIKICIPHKGGRPIVLRIPTPEGAVSKGILQSEEPITGFLRQQIRNYKLEHHFVVATLPASSLVLRHIQLPRMKPRDLSEAIKWEARRVLPFALEEAQIDWVVQNVSISDGGEMQEILLVAVRDNIVERYAKVVSDAGMKLLALDIAPMALGRWLLKDSQDTSLIIDMGAETIQVHFFNGKKLVFSRSLSTGGVEATKAIASVRDIDFQEAETSKLRGDYREEWLEAWYRDLGRELQRSLDYFRTNFSANADVNFARVLLTGGASMTKGISSLIREATGVEPGFAEYASKERTPRHDKIMYNVALGAGLWEGK
jgi:type IV pilus assembly protein PilM